MLGKLFQNSFKITCYVYSGNNRQKFPPLMSLPPWSRQVINTLMPKQNGFHFAEIFDFIVLYYKWDILIKISLKCVPKGPTNNIPSWDQTQQAPSHYLDQRWAQFADTYTCPSYLMSWKYINIMEWKTQNIFGQMCFPRVWQCIQRFQHAWNSSRKFNFLVVIQHQVFEVGKSRTVKMQSGCSLENILAIIQCM